MTAPALAPAFLQAVGTASEAFRMQAAHRPGLGQLIHQRIKAVDQRISDTH
jgi:hypothetical protein